MPIFLFFCITTTTTNQSTYDNTTHLTMNATHSLTTTTTDLLSQNNSATLTPKAVKVFMAVVIPITIVIIIAYSIVWRRGHSVYLVNMEMEHYDHELEQITQDSMYHPHPIPLPPIYIPAIPLHHTQRSRGYPRGPSSNEATMGHMLA
jgi:hypothetical protein